MRPQTRVLTSFLVAATLTIPLSAQQGASFAERVDVNIVNVDVLIMVYRPGWVNKYYDEFQKDYGRIFFGSSDHGEGWRGFIDGAIGGGIKAAQRVQEFLG